MNLYAEFGLQYYDDITNSNISMFLVSFNIAKWYMTGYTALLFMKIQFIYRKSNIHLTHSKEWLDGLDFSTFKYKTWEAFILSWKENLCLTSVLRLDWITFCWFYFLRRKLAHSKIAIEILLNCYLVISNQQKMICSYTSLKSKISIGIS